MIKTKVDVIDALPQYYLPYAKYVNQTRALPDARDGLKQGARFILYSQYLHKLTYDKKTKKASATVSAGMEFSPHGDASVFGTAVRMSQPFSLRYPLIQVVGNNGSQIYGDDYAAARYLEMRSNQIANENLKMLSKDTIDAWELNYTQEQKYPIYFPTLFPNYVNGCTGIGVALATSIPQFNLKEFCNSAITLLEKPNASFEELYCAPDFATRGFIINEEEIKNSLKYGTGKAILLRAKIEYDNQENELIVTELPYQVFSSNVVAQIQKGIENGKIVGVETVFDGSDVDGVKICIKLLKNARPERIVKMLYKETSLQSHYSINMMMLENGLTPKRYGFKDILSTYIENLQNTIYKAYEYDLRNAKNKLPVLEGYLIAFANIDEVIKIIRNSSKKEEAVIELMNKIELTEKQAKAVLDLKLQRLVNLEVLKIQKELEELQKQIEEINNIINNEENFKNKIKSIIEDISNTYGDERRTQIISLSKDEDEEIIEEKTLIIHLSNFGNLYVEEGSTLLTQKRGSKGKKMKLKKNEVIVKTISGKNTAPLLLFSNLGKAYSISLNDLSEKTNVYSLIDIGSEERIIEMTLFEKSKKHICFVTKKGMVKKSLLSNYKGIKKTSGIIALKLNEGDSLIKVMFIDEERIALLSHEGRFKIIETSSIKPIGRVATGVIGIKFNAKDYLVDANICYPNSKQVISITENGMISKTDLTDFNISGRATKGTIIQQGNLKNCILISDEDETVIVISSKNTVKIPIESITLTNKGTIGVMAISEQNTTVGVVRNI